jgi:DNA-directed RNA polymerase subunit beta'
MVIVESATAEKRTPTIIIKAGRTDEKKYLLPTGAHVMVHNGQEVHPGDILVGDDDGIVVVSDAELDAALETAEAIQQREGTIRSAIQGGTSLFEQLNFTEHLENLQSGRPTSLTFTVE